MKSPIDIARPDQVIWDKVAPIFEAGRSSTHWTYVYFIGEYDNGFLKIGKAKDPVKRLRNMQVGNARRLRVERVLLGDVATEKMLHQLWGEYGIVSEQDKRDKKPGPGTEWFKPEIRDALFPIVDDAVRRQLEWLKAAEDFKGILDDLDQQVRQAHIDADHEAKIMAPVYRLGNGTGYATSFDIRL